MDCCVRAVMVVMVSTVGMVTRVGVDVGVGMRVEEEMRRTRGHVDEGEGVDSVGVEGGERGDRRRCQMEELWGCPLETFWRLV